MAMISNMVRFGRRHLHTIVSREIIKPSSPTPSRFKTYNLSSYDQLAPDAYMPMVIFYPNSKLHTNSHVKMMKNSLSRTLTQYYPFAGRLAKTTPSFVDCNDKGVEFLEAHNDNLLSDFLNNTKHEDLDQLFPNGLVWQQLRSCSFEKDRASPLAIQVNQFACGGIAVAVSLSHKIADGSSMCNFFNDWAIMTRLSSTEGQNGSPINPYFISFKNTHLNYQGIPTGKSRDGAVTRSFVFPISRLNDLKLKVIAMTAQSEQPITNPTRMEVLNWLLYKCATKAATKNNLGSFKPTRFALATNMRNKMIELLPKTTIGNIICMPAFSTNNPNQITSPSNFISQLKKLKMEVQGFQNIQDAVERLQHTSDLPTIIKNEQKKFDKYYLSTSMCWYPLYGIDFGWGKPIKVVPSAVTPNCNRFVFVDARNGDGIEVFVSLGKQDMEIFQTDPELRAFC